MRAVIQAVRAADVKIDGKIIASIGRGFAVLLGITDTDTDADIAYICDKILNLRVFCDDEGKMNLSLSDIGGSILLVSQFTLYADARHGRRPSFDRAARAEISLPIYERVKEYIQKTGIPLECGKFGADMLVDIQNDGPTTILLESDKTF